MEELIPKKLKIREDIARILWCKMPTFGYNMDRTTKYDYSCPFCMSEFRTEKNTATKVCGNCGATLIEGEDFKYKRIFSGGPFRRL